MVYLKKDDTSSDELLAQLWGKVEALEQEVKATKAQLAVLPGFTLLHALSSLGSRIALHILEYLLRHIISSILSLVCSH